MKRFSIPHARSSALVGILLLFVGLQGVLAYAPLRVIGQADYTGGTANRGGAVSAETFNTPLGIALDTGGGMYVADRENHRVLYFANDGDGIADRVYGQHGSFTAHIANNDGQGNSGAPSRDNLSAPLSVAVDSQGGVYIADRDNRRVLYYANDGDTSADRVYGQGGNFGTNMVNNDGAGNHSDPSATNFGPYLLGIAVDSQDSLYVSDSVNHRVLYFANDGDTTADRVYGQWDDFTTDARNNDGTGRDGTPNANSLNFPRGLTTDASGGLYVADRDNNRILYFANDGDTTADRVYGQFGDFTTNTESNDGSGGMGTPNADNLSHPKGVAVGPLGGLYVADSLHHRVLYFANDGDTTADGVGGQFGSMESGVPNNNGSGQPGTPGELNTNAPQGIAVDANGLIYLTDTSNHRVLIIECPQWPG